MDADVIDADAMDLDKNNISLDPTPDINNKRQHHPHPDSHNGRKLARQLAADSQGRSDRPDLNPPPRLPSGGPMAEQRKVSVGQVLKQQLLLPSPLTSHDSQPIAVPPSLLLPRPAPNHDP